MALIFPPRDCNTRKNRQSGTAEKLLHHDFVHPDSTAGYTGGCIRNIGQFQESLQGSVLTVQSVHHNNIHVDSCDDFKLLTGEEPISLRQTQKGTGSGCQIRENADHSGCLASERLKS